jgi:hypothetical protein
MCLIRLLSSGGGCNALFPPPGDVPAWRMPEEAVVFSTDLRHAEIPHLPARRPTTIIGTIINRRASCSRSTFWNCKGLINATAWQCWWNEDTLICTNSARSAMFMGWAKLVRIHSTASATLAALDSA